jgi:hypothetical protein
MLRLPILRVGSGLGPIRVVCVAEPNRDLALVNAKGPMGKT